jgi:Antibiotic biosynthesis monooxygenase
MFARMVSLITVPGKREELCRVIEADVLPLVSRQPGFLDHMMLISEPEPRIVTAISVWRTKSDADNYRIAVYPSVVEILAPLLATEPAVQSFRCFSVKGKIRSVEKASILMFPSKTGTKDATE